MNAVQGRSALAGSRAALEPDARTGELSRSESGRRAHPASFGLVLFRRFEGVRA